MTDAEFLEIVLANPVNAALLARLRTLALPDCHLTGGCLFQEVWNRLSGHPPGWGIKDYDVFYFDAQDLSFEAEDAVIRRVAEVTADLGAAIEVNNQARVHLWYPERFGESCPVLRSAREGIDRFLIRSTSVGISVAASSVYAPYGLAGLVAGHLDPNPLTPSPALFQAKAASYRRRWPWLSVV